MFPKNAELIVPESARSTLFTRSPSTRPEKHPTSHRERDVTTLSKWDSVDKQSPSSTRRPRPPVRLCYDWNVRNARPRSNYASSEPSISNLDKRQQHLVTNIKQ